MAETKPSSPTSARQIPAELLPAVDLLLEYFRGQKWGFATFELKAGAPVGKVEEKFRRTLPEP